MYLTYEEYQNMGGTIEIETTFDDFEFEAESIVNWYTFNRLKNEETLPIEVKRCVFRLIQLARIKADLLSSVSNSGVSAEWSANDKPSEPTVASQSNDGVSISYNTLSASEVFGLLNANRKGLDGSQNEIELTVHRYLEGVKNSLGQKVLYRGLYPNE